MPENTSNTDWLIGVSLAAGANIISNIGLNFQKKAHSNRKLMAKRLSSNNIRKRNISASHSPNISTSKSNTNANNDEISMSVSSTIVDDTFEKSYIWEPLWLSGLLLQILGAICDFAALGFAPQSVVAPMAGLTLVSNVILSGIMHNEKASRKTKISTLIIIIGCSVSIIYSASSDDSKSVKDIISIFFSIYFLFYGSISFGYMIVLYLFVKYCNYLNKNNKSHYKKNYYKLHRFSIASLSGTMGSQNVLFGKAVSSLLIFTIKDDGFMFYNPLSYCLILCLILSLYFQLRWLNNGLKRFSTIYIVPVFQVYWILISVLGGLIVYKEFSKMNLIAKILFPIGVIITIFGVYYLTTQGTPEKLLEIDNMKRLRIQEKLNNHLITTDQNIYVIKEENSSSDVSSENGQDLEESPLSNGSSNSPPIEDIKDPLLSPKINKPFKNYEKLEVNKTVNRRRRSSLQHVVSVLYELGEGSILTGSSLGRFLVDPDVLTNSKLGVDKDDEYAILSPNNSIENINIDTRIRGQSDSNISNISNNSSNNSNNILKSNINNNVIQIDTNNNIRRHSIEKTVNINNNQIWNKLKSLTDKIVKPFANLSNVPNNTANNSNNNSIDINENDFNNNNNKYEISITQNSVGIDRLDHLNTYGSVSKSKDIISPQNNSNDSLNESIN